MEPANDNRAENNRIVPGEELEIELHSLDDVIVEEPAPESTTGVQAQRPNSTFPEVDMTYLDERLMYFLQNAGGIPSANNVSWENFIKVRNKVADATVFEIIRKLGNLFFRIENPIYRNGEEFLTGKLILATEIPLDPLKKGLAPILGDDNVDYFLDEFGDRIGREDETKTIDISDPNVLRYLPIMNQVRSICGEYSILRDPYLLLLLLEPADRHYVTLFFDEARSGNLPPINRFDAPPTFDKTKVNAKEYALRRNNIQGITAEQQILPFPELLQEDWLNMLTGSRVSEIPCRAFPKNRKNDTRNPARHSTDKSSGAHRRRTGQGRPRPERYQGTFAPGCSLIDDRGSIPDNRVKSHAHTLVQDIL
jgi:hypothetical protein